MLKFSLDHPLNNINMLIEHLLIVSLVHCLGPLNVRLAYRLILYILSYNE